jgi:phosphatidylglycerol lysyltransferase
MLAGTIDFLFVRLMEILRGNGYARFSLGTASMARVGEEPGASIGEQTIRVVISRMNRISCFKGLRNCKSKFNPA